MGDSEAVLTQTSTPGGYAPAVYPSEYVAGGTNAAFDAGASVVGVAEEFSASTASGDLAASTGNLDATGAAPDASNLGSGNVYNTDLDSAEVPVPAAATYDSGENLADTTHSSGHLPQISAYDSSANGNEASKVNGITFAGVIENGNASDDGHGSASVNQLVVDCALSTEEERLWSIVKANSLDFNAWTSLIDQTGVDNISKIRKVYDAFLAEFPLCYGYWKKYADHEERLGSIDKVVEVYERAVQGVTYSVEMWLHYCVFAMRTYAADPDTIRRLFERGLAYVGTDYLSHLIWDKYIEFEYMQQEWSRIAQIYTCILENPIQQLDRYFNSFKELVATRPLSELRSAEEIAVAAVANSEVGSQETEGEVHPNDVEQYAKPVSSGLIEAEELEKYIAIREEMYKKAKEFDSKIIGFETAVRRPYFHVRPLDVAELENWHNYLDFLEGGDDFNKILKLYERCLIACANYPEYWIRYVLFMEISGSTDLADHALARATQVFVKRQPEIHLFAARFREQRGDITGAQAAYQLVHTEISPGLLEAIIRHANMEHRLGNLDHACSLYEQAIAIEKGKEQSQNLPFLFAQYSRFLYLIAGKVEKAREILHEAVENCQLSKPLLEALIHLESIQSLPKRIDYLDSLVEKFIVPNPESLNAASINERKELSSIFLEFVDLFGDMQSIKKADERHAKLFLRHKSTSESKKRHAEDFLASDKTKLVKSDVNPSTSSVMGVYPGAHTQWQTAYGLQPQPWPQVTQGQGQQWNPGYTPQAAYSAYGSYGSSYMPTQIQTSVSQTAAYGVYPPIHPAQAFPQQSYPQSAALTSSQQPTSVPPPAYYSNYY